jgi:hypothetical protein
MFHYCKDARNVDKVSYLLRAVIYLHEVFNISPRKGESKNGEIFRMQMFLPATGISCDMSLSLPYARQLVHSLLRNHLIAKLHNSRNFNVRFCFAYY